MSHRPRVVVSCRQRDSEHVSVVAKFVTFDVTACNISQSPILEPSHGEMSIVHPTLQLKFTLNASVRLCCSITQTATNRI